MTNEATLNLKQQTLEALQRVAFSDMNDFLERLPDGGIRFKDLDQIPEEKLVCVREMEFDEAAPNKIRKIALHDSFWALHLLALHCEENESKDTTQDS